MKWNWKTLAATSGVLLALAFVVARINSAFVARPPAWMHPTEHRSPPLDRDARLGLGWSQLQLVREQAELQAKMRHQGLGSLRLMMVGSDPQEVVSWNSEALVNQGFQPLANFECSAPVSADRFVGYYTMEGDPLPYTSKYDPRQSNTFVCTLHLPAAINPGATALVFQVTRPKSRVRIPAKGNGPYEVHLGRLPSPDTTIAAWSIALPDHTEVVRHSPAQGPLILTDPGVMVLWINSRLDPPESAAALFFRPPPK